jgi:hypothetical protein
VKTPNPNAGSGIGVYISESCVPDETTLKLPPKLLAKLLVLMLNLSGEKPVMLSAVTIVQR